MDETTIIKTSPSPPPEVIDTIHVEEFESPVLKKMHMDYNSDNSVNLMSYEAPPQTTEGSGLDIKPDIGVTKVS